VDAKSGGGTLEGLIDELARVLHEPESARVLVLRAGFPAADLPGFDVPRVFWARVIRAAADGKLVGGVRALVDEVVKQYPGNGVFAGYRAQAAAASQGGDSGERLEPGDPSPPLPVTPTSKPTTASGRTPVAGAAIYDVFLSHSSADKPAVEAVAVRLRDEAGLRPFLDRWELVPGEPWMPALERAIERSTTVAVFFGPHGRGAWHDQESQLALVLAAAEHGKRVIPVLLPGARKEDVGGFMRLQTWVELGQGDGFERLIAGVTGRAPGPGGGSSSGAGVEPRSAEPSRPPVSPEQPRHLERASSRDGLDGPLRRAPELGQEPVAEAKAATPVVVLALANDRAVGGRPLRNLPAERRAIQQQLAARAEVRVLSDALLEEVWDVFGEESIEGRVQVFHFAGHASGSWLAFENEAGAPVNAHAEGLAGFLGRQDGLVLVFLNGCSTLSQVTRLRQGVRAVVATTDAILDEAAAELAGRFYAGLRSKALERAFLDAVDFMKAKYGADPRGVIRRELVHEDENEIVTWPWILDCDEACKKWRLGQEPPGLLPAVPPNEDEVDEVKADDQEPWEIGVALAMLHVDIMRLFVVRFGDATNHVNSDRIEEFESLADDRIRVLDQHLSAFASALSAANRKEAFSLRANLGSSLNRVKHPGRDENAARVIAANLGCVALRIAELISRIHPSRLANIEKDVDQATKEVGEWSVREHWVDALATRRFRAQSKLLERARHLRTIADDFDHILAVPYLLIDKWALSVGSGHGG
jgi:TIR domain/Effector-associated domain 1/CHAT domain